MDNEFTTVHDLSTGTKLRRMNRGSKQMTILYLSMLILGVFVHPVEALNWKRAISWGGGLLPRSFSSFGGGGKENLEKRAANKTVWISAKVYQGQSFFEEWDFYSGPDYTHGLVNYLNKSEALSTGLAYITPDGRANMQVDNVTTLTLDEVNTQTKLRPSIRISTITKYNQGLFILDVAKAPYGCGAWPAFWSTNENWPVDGEIDIIENVHSSVSNQVSWHTTAGCNLIYPGNFTGTAGSTICDHNYMSNTGCGIVDPSIASFGPTFNAKGGGVYATKWDSESIDVWFFYRSAIPDDILNGLPDPQSWPTPSASLSGLGCPIDTYFRNHELIFDTTLCGDWAGSESYSDAGCPGTCAERVVEPSNFVNATWSINSIKIYNKTIINTAYLEAGASSPVWLFRAWGWSALVAVGILWFGEVGW